MACLPRVALALGVALLAAGASSAPERLPGPVPARLVRVVDGDTVEVVASIWLGQEVRIGVRLDGIDAPELRGRCAGERTAARVAAVTLAELAAGPLSLVDVRYGKFAGRVVARLLDAGGRDLGAELVRRGHARAYGGGTRAGWCG